MQVAKNYKKSVATSRTEFIHSGREERNQASRKMSALSFCWAGPFKGLGFFP